METQSGELTMHALRMTVTIPETRRLEITIPPGLPSGPAEIIVLTGAGIATEGARTRALGADTFSEIAEWRKSRGTWRPREELDRTLEEERSGWEDNG